MRPYSTALRFICVWSQAPVGIAPAGDLARFYSMLERGGTLDGVNVLRPENRQGGTSLEVEGTDATLGQFARRSLGLALQDERMGSPGDKPNKTFGHGGAGTSVGWADPDSGLAVGYITNGFRGNYANNPRMAAISKRFATLVSEMLATPKLPLNKSKPLNKR